MMPQPKRERCPNFSTDEEEALLVLVEKYVDVLENKTTDAAMWKEKKNVWEKIANEFESCSEIKRSAKNLKGKYENLKQKLKKNKMSYSPKSNDSNGGANDDSSNENPDMVIKTETIDEDGSVEELISPTITPIKIPSHVLRSAVNSSNIMNNEDMIASSDGMEKKRKIDSQKRIKDTHNKRIEIFDKQIEYFQNEENRAVEKHEWHKKEAELKIEILKLELEHKLKELTNAVQIISKQ